MAISHVGGTTNAQANGGDPVLTLSGIAGLAQDDLVIISFGIGDSDGVDFTMAVLTGTGWTKRQDLFANDLQQASLGTFWKFMGASPDTSVTLDGLGGTNAACAAACIAFRGVDTTTPFDVADTTATGINSYIANPGSINWTTAGAWTVIAGASAHTNGAVTYTMPTGYTTNPQSVGANDTNDITVGIAYKTSPASPEDPGNMSPSGGDVADFSWCAVTMALRPAGAAAGGRSMLRRRLSSGIWTASRQSW